MTPNRPLDALLTNLSPAERTAVHLLKFTITTYNTRDGLGLFTGPQRYSVLADRARLAAVKTTTLTRFWSELIAALRLPLTPKRTDDTLHQLLASGNDTLVLRSIANDTPSLVTLARALADQDKQARRDATLNDEEGELP